jgi:hypothetical protein
MNPYKAIQQLRAAIKEYEPCLNCGTKACQDMLRALDDTSFVNKPVIFKKVEEYQRGDRVVAIQTMDIKDRFRTEFSPGMTGTVFQPAGYHSKYSGAEVRWDAGNMNTIFNGDVVLFDEAVELAKITRLAEDPES